MSKWNVRYRRESDDGYEYESGSVEADTQSEAEEKAQREAKHGWEVDELTRLCDFCEPEPHENCDAYTEITVVDPLRENEPAERPAWVCMEHFNVVQNLPKYASHGAD